MERHLKKNYTVKTNNLKQTKDKRGNANQITVESIDSPRTTTGTIGVNKLASEAGVFIRAKVNGVNANMLIHTGATVTLISDDLFKKMENPLITTMNREILSASGSALQITGKTIIDIEIDTCVYTNVAVIADINVDGILGLDFQRSQNCIMDISKSCILMYNQKVDLVFEGQIGCYRVAVAETVKCASKK